MVGSKFDVVRDDAGGVSVLSVSGELDAATVPQFEQALLVALCDRDVVINLGGLRFMDSTALAALVRGQRKAAGLGLKLHLTDLPPMIARLLQTTDVAKIFDTYPSVAEALRVLSAATSPHTARTHAAAGGPSGVRVESSLPSASDADVSSTD
ncbi:MAG: STAS domain-containing protein, partial [Micromonosporaceae bacterium]